MGSEKLDRLQKMERVVNSADMSISKREKPQKIKKHINMPKEWDEAIKNNYAGTVTSYILTALKKQLEKDRYI